MSHSSASRSRVPAGVRAGGEFSVESRAEPGISLTEPQAPSGRPMTVAGTSRILNMQRAYSLRQSLTRPPAITGDDTVAEMIKKWGKYVVANSEMDAQEYAAEQGWVPMDPDEEAALRARTGSSVSAGATAWKTPGGSIVFLDPRLSAKEGAWRSRTSASMRWSVVNLPRRLCAQAMTQDLRDFVEERGGDPEDILEGFVERALSKTGPEAARDAMRSRLTASSALREVAVYGVEAPRPMHEYGTDVEAYKDAVERRQAALVRLCADEQELRRVFGALDPSKDDEATIHAPMTYPSEYTFNQVLESARRTRREHATRQAAAELIAERFGMADDLFLTQQRRTSDDRHSATVWEDKKNIPAGHAAAAERSTFRRDGMGHVEIDESVDLNDFHAVEAEWAHLSSRVPHTTAPARMAFRLTGRHRAAGVYSPARDAIAVDPRHPSSMWHEYVHHLDHTSENGQVSLSDEFRPILREAQRAIAADDRIASTGKSLDYWRSPTEVLSRSAELWLHWRGVTTSLNGDEHKYDGNPAYETLYPLREQIESFFDRTFGDPT